MHKELCQLSVHFFAAVVCLFVVTFIYTNSILAHVGPMCIYWKHKLKNGSPQSQSRGQKTPVSHHHDHHYSRLLTSSKLVMSIRLWSLAITPCKFSLLTPEQDGETTEGEKCLQKTESSTIKGFNLFLSSKC